MADYEQIKAELDGVAIEDNPRLVQAKSRDFYWYSPILKRQLDNVTGDLLVSPKNEDEVIRVLSCRAIISLSLRFFSSRETSSSYFLSASVLGRSE